MSDPIRVIPMDMIESEEYLELVHRLTDIYYEMNRYSKTRVKRSWDHVYKNTKSGEFPQYYLTKMFPERFTNCTGENAKKFLMRHRRFNALREPTRLKKYKGLYKADFQDMICLKNMSVIEIKVIDKTIRAYLSGASKNWIQAIKNRQIIADFFMVYLKNEDEYTFELYKVRCSNDLRFLYK